MLEILVALMVFAIVAKISLRSIGDTLRRERVAKAAAVVGSDLEQAFAIAARQRLPVRVLIDTVNRKVSVVDRNAQTLVYKTRSFENGGAFEIDSLRSNTPNIDIMPNGMATADLTIRLLILTTGGAKYTKTIQASKGGLVRVDNR